MDLSILNGSEQIHKLPKYINTRDEEWKKYDKSE